MRATFGEMNKVISERGQPFPKMRRPWLIKIDPDKIRDVIGKGGAVIAASPKRRCIG